MKPKYDIRNQIRLHRVKAGDMTQQELAGLVGATRQTIVSIEKGKYNPSVGLALRIAKVLGASIEELFELDEEEGDANG
ncbi:MAG TPA: helix-turn-helix transcriptional regulator [Candidatus Krumholzibacteriaceae bacterium]